MATSQSNNVCDSSTDANFRQWSKAISDAFGSWLANFVNTACPVSVVCTITSGTSTWKFTVELC